MYAIKTQSVIWNTGGVRKHFCPHYIMPDGYKSKTDAKNAVRDIGLPDYELRYIRFMDQWYAVYLDSYFKGLVLSKEQISYHTEPFTAFRTCCHEEFDPGPFRQDPFNAGKAWTDGIAFDLSLTELGSSKKSPVRAEPSHILVEKAVSPAISVDSDIETVRSNTLIMLGLPHYVGAIKMDSRDPKYVMRIMLHYYSERSCEYKLKEAAGFAYYDPIRGKGYADKSRFDKDRKELLSKCDNTEIPYFERRVLTDLDGNIFKETRREERI